MDFALRRDARESRAGGGRRERDVRVSGVWRAGLVVAVVFAAVWVCVIVWWRAGDVAPGATRMLVWLAVVPVGILSVLWIGARIRRTRRASAGAAVPEDAADPDTAGSADPPSPQWPLGILAAAARLGCGDGAQRLSRHVSELPRPGLHPTLRDRDGLPVIACFDAGLDTGAVQDRLRPGPGQRVSEEHLRALALLEPVALELFEAAARLLPPLPEVEERVIAGLRRSVAAAPRESGSVHVVALLPQDVPSALREDCDSWLRELAADCGLDPRRSTFEVLVEQDAESTWRRLSRLVAEQPAAGAQWQLLLAAASLIGERGLHALVSSGRLARADNAEGLVPGEGAAGLLLRPATSVLPAGYEPGPEIASLRTIACEADAPARQAARSTGDLLAAAMNGATVMREDIAMVLSDADQRPSRSVEAAVAASAACPELDPVTACPGLGAASGHLGHAGPLVLLALAAERVREAGTPTLALSLASASTRTAALLRIAAAEELPDTPANEPGATPGLAA